MRDVEEFPCAGDAEALDFCRNLVAEMVLRFDISREEAIARINQQWSQTDDGTDQPRTLIIGRDIVYHEGTDYWAKTIYYGKESFWWLPGANPQPLPPPGD